MFKELDPTLQQELTAAFRLEMNEKIEVISDCLIKLEKDHKPGDHQEILEEIFRAAHSLKGASRGIGLDAVGDVSHCMESFFSVLKKQSIAPPSAAVDIALEALDFIKFAFDEFVQDRQPSSVRGKSLGEKLTKLARQLAENPESSANSLPSATRAVNHSTQEVAVQPIAPKRWRPPALAESTPAESTPAESTPAESTPAESTPAEITPAATAILTSAAAQPTQPITAATATTTNNADISTPPEPKEPTPIAHYDTQSVHVSVDKLERLSAWADEIHVNHLDLNDQLSKVSQLLNRVEELENWLEMVPELPSKVGDAMTDLHMLGSTLHHELGTSSRQLQLLTQTFRQDIQLLRLVKVATLTRPMVRMIRDLSRELHKKATLTITGDDLEMDRAVLGFVRDPLTHLLRNALDHGIESPEQRLAKGKPAEGSIQIHIQREGNGIIVQIIDDGAGMDIEEIGQAAQRKGFIRPEMLSSLDPKEILDLIFQAGFSSRAILTAVSGRGVGLDVVRTNLISIGGRVSVETNLGSGTTFTLCLPLTLATERGLLIRVAERLMAIPTKRVERIHMINLAEIVRIENREVVILEGKPALLVRLADILELGKASQPLSTQQSLPAVVISNGWQQVAYLVDDVEGEREIVIKKLQPPLYHVANIAGAAVTGTGQVVVVLNPAELVESALQRKHTSLRVEEEAMEPIKPSILVVDDSITTRTLERSILQGAGFEVHLAVNGAEALEALQHHDFNLVVTDVQMPIMDGIELTERIKQSETHREIPVIIVSSLGSDADKQEGVRVGADAYIVKSQFETQALLEVVEELLA